MSTGEIPFYGRSIAQITGAVGYHQESLKVEKHFNKVISILIRNCLQWNPERRPDFVDIVAFLEKEKMKVDKKNPAKPFVDNLADFFN